MNVIQMADKRSPQTEDGYTRLANELLDALLCAGLSSRQWAVVMAVVRKTYGFNKRSDDIGLGQLAAMTGIDKAHLSRTVRELADAGVLNRTEGHHAYTLSVNKNYAAWGLLKQQRLLKEQPLVADLATGWVADSATPPVADSATTKDNSSKDNYQNTNPKDKHAPAARRVSGERADQKGRAVTSLNAEQQEGFDRFWSEYPSRKSKAAALKAWAKLRPDADLLATILAGLDASKQSEQWRRGIVPHAASWLNGARWTDEIATSYDAAAIEVIDAYNAALGESAGYMDAEVFSDSRAASIAHFCALPGRKPQFWLQFFPWVRKSIDLPPHVGFDWLIDPKNFAAILGGHHAKPQ